MLDDFRELWKFAPVVVLSLVAFWLWHKIMIDKVEMIAEKLERERDDWKKLAFALMEKLGIKTPANLLPGSTTFKKKEEK
jgi:hypothetical protein